MKKDSEATAKKKPKVNAAQLRVQKGGSFDQYDKENWEKERKEVEVARSGRRRAGRRPLLNSPLLRLESRTKAVWWVTSGGDLTDFDARFVPVLLVLQTSPSWIFPPTSRPSSPTPLISLTSS